MRTTRKNDELTWTWLLSTIAAASIILTTAMERNEAGSASGVMVWASILSVFVLALNVSDIFRKNR